MGIESPPMVHSVLLATIECIDEQVRAIWKIVEPSTVQQLDPSDQAAVDALIRELHATISKLNQPACRAEMARHAQWMRDYFDPSGGQRRRSG
jgi:hypothetical protein